MMYFYPLGFSVYKDVERAKYFSYLPKFRIYHNLLNPNWNHSCTLKNRLNFAHKDKLRKTFGDFWILNSISHRTHM